MGFGAHYLEQDSGAPYTVIIFDIRIVTGSSPIPEYQTHHHLKLNVQ